MLLSQNSRAFKDAGDMQQNLKPKIKFVRIRIGWKSELADNGTRLYRVMATHNNYSWHEAFVGTKSEAKVILEAFLKVGYERAKK